MKASVHAHAHAGVYYERARGARLDTSTRCAAFSFDFLKLKNRS
jgi:hypothetical protein